jgi:hypothetical protein
VAAGRRVVACGGAVGGGQVARLEIGLVGIADGLRGARLGHGRIVVSEQEAPNILANLV